MFTFARVKIGFKCVNLLQFPGSVFEKNMFLNLSKKDKWTNLHQDVTHFDVSISDTVPTPLNSAVDQLPPPHTLLLFGVKVADKDEIG